MEAVAKLYCWPWQIWSSGFKSDLDASALRPNKTTCICRWEQSWPVQSTKRITISDKRSTLSYSEARAWPAVFPAWFKLSVTTSLLNRLKNTRRKWPNEKSMFWSVTHEQWSRSQCLSFGALNYSIDWAWLGLNHARLSFQGQMVREIHGRQRRVATFTVDRLLIICLMHYYSICSQEKLGLNYCHHYPSSGQLPLI